MSFKPKNILAEASCEILCSYSHILIMRANQRAGFHLFIWLFSKYSLLIGWWWWCSGSANGYCQICWQVCFHFTKFLFRSLCFLKRKWPNMVYISAMTFKKFFFCFYLFFDFRLNFFHFELCFFRRLRAFFLFREDIFRTRTIVFFILFIMLITIVCAMKCFWKNITNKGNLQKGMGSIVVCRLFVFWIIIHNVSIDPQMWKYASV